MSTRTYYRVVLETKSVLSVGAADSDLTDNDVALDSRGLPMIPATSLAGAYRSFFWDPHGIVRDADGTVKEDHRDKVCRRIFGSLEDGRESAVRVYDATLVRQADEPRVEARHNEAVSIRDSVKLKEGEKVPDPQKKFDRQVVEPGARFETFIEIVDEEHCCEILQSTKCGVHSCRNS